MNLNPNDEYALKQDLKTDLLCKNSEVGCSVRIEKSDKSLFTAVCAQKASQGCQWRAHARCYDTVWIIKTAQTEHTCIPMELT